MLLAGDPRSPSSVSRSIVTAGKDAADPFREDSRSKKITLKSASKLHHLAERLRSGLAPRPNATAGIHPVNSSGMDTEYSSKIMIKLLLTNCVGDVFNSLYIALKQNSFTRLQPEIYSHILKVCVADITRISLLRHRFKWLQNLIGSDRMFDMDARDVFNAILISSFMGDFQTAFSVFLNSIEAQPKIKREAMVYKAMMAAFLREGDPHRAIFVWDLMNKEVAGCRSDVDALSLFFKARVMIAGIANSYEILSLYEKSVPLHKRSRIIYDVLISLLKHNETQVKDAEEMLLRLQRRMPYTYGLSFGTDPDTKPSKKELELARSKGEFIVRIPETSSEIASLEIPAPTVSWHDSTEGAMLIDDKPRDFLGTFVGIESYLALCSVYMSCEHLDKAYELIMSMHRRVNNLEIDVILSMKYFTTLASLALKKADYETVFHCLDTKFLYISDDTIIQIYESVKNNGSSRGDHSVDENIITSIRSLIELAVSERRFRYAKGGTLAPYEPSDWSKSEI